MFTSGWCPPVAQKLKEEFGRQVSQQRGLGLEGEACMKRSGIVCTEENRKWLRESWKKQLQTQKDSEHLEFRLEVWCSLGSQ